MQRRNVPRLEWRWWVAAAAIAAGALTIGYFTDQERGAARRRRVRNRSAHLGAQARKTIWRQSKHAMAQAIGFVQRSSHRSPKPIYGPTLLDRVESELFEDPDVPHGRLTFDVEGHTVVLRGEMETRSQIEWVEAKVRTIAGVAGVRNLLHLPGTPAPNKAAALQLVVAAPESGEWPFEPPPDVDSEA